MKNIIAILALVVLSVFGAKAQNEVKNNDEYIKVITLRASKIATTLHITDTLKLKKITNIIRDQYSNLNDIYTARDLKIKDIKLQVQDKAERDVAIAQENSTAQVVLAKLHQKYLKKLNSKLSSNQIDIVKNGMTYNVLPITYKAYQEQILTLTEEQKKQIFAWLTEAREYAMDAESSEKKHAWFGKYKGKINNYLSAAGYDLKKEGIEWEKRIKAATNTNKKS